METALPPPSSIRRVLVLGSPHKPGAHELAREIAAFCAARGMEAVLDLDGAACVVAKAAEAQLAIAVGGDGTLLGVARMLADVAPPTIGINVGKLGFLAEFSADDVREYLAGGPAPGAVVPRLMLRCRTERDPARVLFALNDAVITQGPLTKILAIDMEVNGERATRYNADGVVVSTPVGSTAYALSLGGPILTPGADSMIVTPIAPHSLTNRPLVLEGSTRLTFRATRESPTLALVLDGQEIVPLDVGEAVWIERAPRPFPLAARRGRSFFELLRAKLHWGEEPAYRT